MFDDELIPGFASVTVTKMGHLVEVQYLEKENKRSNILKLNKDEYLVLDTGEIKEYNHIENRSQSENSLRQTFKKLRYLINNNFRGNDNELFVTLTYAENMQDPERLYKDVEKFIKKLRYKFKDKTTIDYINVVEPQGRGAWHCHVLLRFNDLDDIYIPNDEVREMWGNGFVTVKSLNNVDNIGAYVSAYLADIELNDKTDLETVNRLLNEERKAVKFIDGKKYIKGGRLHLYPPGMKLYRTSRGIKKPNRVRMKYEDLKKEVVGSAKPHYSRVYKIDEENFKNTVIHEQYNLKRSISKG